MSPPTVAIALTVNGEPVAETVEARKSLVDFLRDDLALTGLGRAEENGGAQAEPASRQT